jgi:hypothetical protein
MKYQHELSITTLGHGHNAQPHRAGRRAGGYRMLGQSRFLGLAFDNKKLDALSGPALEWGNVVECYFLDLRLRELEPG